MCLYRSPIGTKKLLKRLDKKGYIIAYKKFMVHKGKDGIEITTKCKNASVKLNRSGFFISNRLRTDKKCFDLNDKINKGIHVFLDKSQENNLIKVKCFKRDFVAAGSCNRYYHHQDNYVSEQAVFYKVQIDKKELIKYALKLIENNVNYYIDTIEHKISDNKNIIIDLKREIDDREEEKSDCEKQIKELYKDLKVAKKNSNKVLI